MSKAQVPIVVGGVIGGAVVTYFLLTKNSSGTKTIEYEIKKTPDIPPPSPVPFVSKEIEPRVLEQLPPSLPSEKSVEVFKTTPQIDAQTVVHTLSQNQPKSPELSVSNTISDIIHNFIGNALYFGCYVVIGASLYYLSSKLYTEEVLRGLTNRRKIESPVWKLNWIHKFLFSPQINQLDLPIYFDPDAIGDTDLFGSNFLLIAAQKSDFNMIEFLIEEGADIHCTNEAGKSFLHYFALAVAKSGNWGLMNLLKKSPKYPITDKQLKYWIDFAVNQKKEIADLQVFLDTKANEDELSKRWLIRWVKQKFPTKYLRSVFGIPDSLV